MGDLMANDWQVYVESKVPAHQLRVLEELAQLTDRRNKLELFTLTPYFLTLPQEEQDRLAGQLVHMVNYEQSLVSRVAAF